MEGRYTWITMFDVLSIIKRAINGKVGIQHASGQWGEVFKMDATEEMKIYGFQDSSSHSIVVYSIWNALWQRRNPKIKYINDSLLYWSFYHA